MIWTYLKYIKNPIYVIIGTTAKFIFKNLFFKRLEWKDYNELTRLSIGLIPAQNWYNMCKLLMRVTITPFSEVTQIDQIAQIVQNTAFNSNIKKSSKEIEQEQQDPSWKWIFISVILGGLFQKGTFFMRNFILLPFKIGTWLFAGGLVGIRVDQMLHWFDFLKINIPNWFYNKLLDTHLNWLNWIKGVGKIDSLTTKDLEEIKIKNTPKLETPTSDETPKPDTYMYLTKNQWLVVFTVVSLSIIICTGIYLKWGFGDDGPSDSSSKKLYDKLEDTKVPPLSPETESVAYMAKIRAHLDENRSRQIFASPKPYSSITPEPNIPLPNTPEQIELALERSRIKMSLWEKFKNSLPNVLPNKPSVPLSPESTITGQIELRDLTNKVATQNTENIASTSNLRSNSPSSSGSGLNSGTNTPKFRPFPSTPEGEIGLRGLHSPRNIPVIPESGYNLNSPSPWGDPLRSQTPVESFPISAVSDKTPTQSPYQTPIASTSQALPSSTSDIIKETKPLSPLSEQELKFNDATGLW